MFCHKCGAKLLEGAKFCSACGNPIKITSSSDEKREFKDNTSYQQKYRSQNSGCFRFLFLGIMILFLLFIVLSFRGCYRVILFTHYLHDGYFHPSYSNHISI